MIRIFYFFLLIILFNFLFSQASKPKPVEVFAGISTYRWEIKRLLLEYTNNIMPLIIKDENNLKANTIIYDEKKEMGYAFGNVFFENKKDKILMTSDEGTYDTKKKEIIAKKNPVIILKEDNTIAKSDIVKAYPDDNYVILLGNVWITNENYVMEGDKGVIYQNTGKFKITGNAKAKQEGSVLTADKIDIDSKNKKLQSYTAVGNVIIEDKKEGYVIHSGRLDYFKDLGYSKITKNPVIIFTNNNVTAYSVVMEKFDKEEKANLLGNVIIIQGKKRAYSKWGEYFTKTKMMILTGNPILVNEDSKFNSQKIIVNVESGIMSMIGKGTGFYEYNKK